MKQHVHVIEPHNPKALFGKPALFIIAKAAGLEPRFVNDAVYIKNTNEMFRPDINIAQAMTLAINHGLSVEVKTHSLAKDGSIEVNITSKSGITKCYMIPAIKPLEINTFEKTSDVAQRSIALAITTFIATA